MRGCRDYLRLLYSVNGGNVPTHHIKLSKNTTTRHSHGMRSQGFTRILAWPRRMPCQGSANSVTSRRGSLGK